MDEKRLLQVAIAVAVLLPLILILAIWKTHTRMEREAVQAAITEKQEAAQAAITEKQEAAQAAMAAEKSAEEDGYRAYRNASDPKTMPSGKAAGWVVGWHRAQTDAEAAAEALRREQERVQRLEVQEQIWYDAECWLQDNGFYGYGGDYYKIYQAVKELMDIEPVSYDKRVRHRHLISAMFSDLERIKYQDLKGYLAEKGIFRESDWLELSYLASKHGWKAKR